LTNFDETRLNDAQWSPTADQLLKLPISKSQNGGGRHLENHKNYDITATI